jgi:hypothetical protein
MKWEGRVLIKYLVIPKSPIKLNIKYLYINIYIYTYLLLKGDEPCYKINLAMNVALWISIQNCVQYSRWWGKF